jgi:hypothetical protein
MTLSSPARKGGVHIAAIRARFGDLERRALRADPGQFLYCRRTPPAARLMDDRKLLQAEDGVWFIPDSFQRPHPFV